MECASALRVSLSDPNSPGDTISFYTTYQELPKVHCRGIILNLLPMSPIGACLTPHMLICLSHAVDASSYILSLLLYPIPYPLARTLTLKTAISVDAHSITDIFDSLKSFGVEIRTNRLDRSQTLVLYVSPNSSWGRCYNRHISGPIYPLKIVFTDILYQASNSFSVQRIEWAYETEAIASEEMLTSIYCGLWNQLK